jgi:hypothetical protein
LRDTKHKIKYKDAHVNGQHGASARNVAFSDNGCPKPDRAVPLSENAVYQPRSEYAGENC